MASPVHLWRKSRQAISDAVDPGTTKRARGGKRLVPQQLNLRNGPTMPICRQLASWAITVILALPLPGWTMDFAYVYDTLPDGSSWAKELAFVGTIQPGDHARLLELVRRDPVSYYLSTGVFTLNSKGGDVQEALKVAEIVRRSYPRVFVNKECSSACVFVFLAGATRFASKANLGIHRPTYHASYFSSLSATQAQEKYAELDRHTRKYLEVARFPNDLIERMFTTASTNVYWLTTADIQRIGKMPPWHHELAIAKCDYDKMDKARTPQEADAYLDRYNDCLAAMVRPEKFRFIDEVLGSDRPDRWEQLKRRLQQ